MSDVKNSNEYKLDSNQRKELIDALLNVRLSLNVKKIVSDRIEKNELKKLIEEQTIKLQDVKVKGEIDNLFEEYFGSKEKDNSTLSIEEMGKIIESRTNENNHSLIKEFKPKKNTDASV